MHGVQPISHLTFAETTSIASANGSNTGGILEGVTGIAPSLSLPNAGVLLGTATALMLGLVGVRVHRGRAGDELARIRTEGDAAGGKNVALLAGHNLVAREVPLSAVTATFTTGC